MGNIITYLGDKGLPQLRKDVEDAIGKKAVESGIKSGFVSKSKSGKIYLSKKGMDRYIAIQCQKMIGRMIGRILF